jgi:hypothetical protein
VPDLLEDPMPSELPIACSLSAGDLSTRLREMAELGRAALVDVRRDHSRAELRFAAGAGAGVRDRVQGIVAAESRCCAFLAMTVTDEPDTVVLTIEAPDDAAVVLAELVDAFRGQPQAA